MAKKNEVRLLIKARNKFFQENPGLLDNLRDTVGEYQYLKNRLEKAFIAGWDAAKKESKQ